MLTEQNQDEQIVLKFNFIDVLVKSLGIRE